MVLEKGGPNVKYGIEITYVGKPNSPKKKWYGSDSLARDAAHNMYAQRKNVAIVRDIQEDK